MTYMLLTGKPPFDGANEKSIFKKIKEAHIDFSNPIWAKVSPHAKELVLQMLNPDRDKRITAKEALQSEWFARHKKEIKMGDADGDIEKNVMDALSKFVNYGKLKKTALMVIANRKSHDELKDLRKAFVALDVDHSGSITVEELKQLFIKHSIEDEAVVGEIFKAADVDSSGELQYMEFLAATIEARCLVDRDAFADAFDQIAQGEEFITKTHLKKMFGEKLPKKVLAEIIDEVDVNKDGKISKEEFLSLVDAHEAKVYDDIITEI